MTPLVKALLAVALVVPLVGYVAGSLASSGAETPQRQDTVYVDDARPSPTRDNRPTQVPATDDEARVVAPTPVDDDDADERDDEQDDDTDDGADTDDTDD